MFETREKVVGAGGTGGWWIGSWAVAAVLLLAVPAASRAQWPGDLELRGGAAVPAGDLAEVGDPGAAVGLGAAWRLGDRFAFRVDGDLEIFSETRVGSPGGVVLPRAYLWHYHAGLEADVVTGDDSPWRLRVRGGAGGTTYDTERFIEHGDDFLDTYFSVSGAVLAGREIRPGIEAGVAGQVFVTFTDKERTREIAERSPLLNSFSRASSFPIQLYVRWMR